MKKIEGARRADGFHFAIVASRYNPEIVDGLIKGALEALRGAGAESKDVVLIRTPGAFEIPLAAKHAASSGRYDAVIAIGCVIRGETPHFEYISREASRGIGEAGLAAGVPVTFGVLTAETEDQAIARSGPGPQNRGYEAAMAAIEMVNLLRQI